MAHVMLMTGPERRRRWSSEERRVILMAAFTPGAVVADVSRQYEVSTSLIYKWRREVMAARAEAQFVPAVIVDGPSDLEPLARSEPAIVVELASGARVTIGAAASASMVSATLRALR
jgi:transposase